MVVNPFISYISSASVLNYWPKSLARSAVIQYSPRRLLRSRDFSDLLPQCLYFYRKSDYSWRKITAWPLGMTQLRQTLALRGSSEVRVVIFDFRWEMIAAFSASESIFVLQKSQRAVLKMIYLMSWFALRILCSPHVLPGWWSEIQMTIFWFTSYKWTPDISNLLSPFCGGDAFY